MLEKLNDNFSLKDGGFSTYEDTTDLGRHRWYYYKEGFSPNLVKKAIEETKATKDDLIIDPFNGSGTTTLTAALLGHRATGVEVNPFTAFLSAVKLKNINIDNLRTELPKLIKACRKGSTSGLVGYSTFSYRRGLKKWLFNKNILSSFEGGWRYISKLKNKELAKVMQLILITSAMDNCNAVRDGKCLRYRKIWKTYKFGTDTFIESVLGKAKEIEADLAALPVTGNAKIITGDIRNVVKKNKELQNFKLCITSPPYLNTFDYTDIYRPELFLGKFLTDNTGLYKLRLKTVRSHIQAKWEEPTQTEFGIIYQQTIDYINKNKRLLMHKNIPSMVQAYFEDMQAVLTTLRDHAQKDAQVWLVVSNSAYANLEVPVDLILADIATRAGWFLKEIGVLRYIRKRKTKYSKKITHLRESVIILSKSAF